MRAYIYIYIYIYAYLYVFTYVIVYTYNVSYASFLHKVLSLLIPEIPGSLVTNMLDCNNILIEFELRFRYYVHFKIEINFFISWSYGWHSTSEVLQRLIWH